MNRLTKPRVKQNTRDSFGNFAELDFDQLESRMMLAGDVTATISGGTLTLTGDSLDNGVFFTQVGTDFFVITDGTTTINGQAAVAFQGVSNLTANLGNGNDTLIAFTTTLSGDLNVLAGAGNDTVGLIGMTVQGEANVSLGSGAVNAFVANGLVVGTAPNQDALRVFGSNEAGSTDIVQIDNSVLFEDLLMDLAEGTNIFQANNLFIYHDFEYYGGDETDILVLNNVLAGIAPTTTTPDNIDIWLEGGDDTIVMNTVFAPDRLAVYGGEGFDGAAVSLAVGTPIQIEEFEVVV